MKRALLLLCFGFILKNCLGQDDVHLQTLLNFLELHNNKVENHLARMGFKKTFLFAEDKTESGFTRTYLSKDTEYTQFLKVNNHESGTDLSFETTSASDYQNLIGELLKSGFTYTPEKQQSGLSSMYFQKNELSIESETEKREGVPTYCLRFRKTRLPKLKEINYAEDLLNLNTHECLSTLFGKQNVRKDVFYYSATDSNKCSVLFPNTNHEAIFIWNDEENYKDLSFIIFGGHLKSEEHTENVNQVRHNEWISRQGVYCGMSIRELQLLNKEVVSFHNWKTEAAGYVSTRNKGRLDFEKIGIVLNCLNCSYIEKNNNNDIQSDEAIEENQKIFVNTFIVMAEKKKAQGMYLSSTR